MIRACLLSLLAVPLLFAADDFVKPDKINIHTWVREDMFAGWIANDTVTFERGVKKLDLYGADHPNDPNMLAWKYLVASYRMLQARAAGDDASYSRELATAKELRGRIFARDLRDPGPYIIVGSSLVRTACVAPEGDRAWMFRDGRDLLAKVPGLQGDVFDQLPPHMRGELWAQIAFASDRVGDAAARDQALDNMVAKLAGTPYETRARSWQKGTTLAKEKDYACLSCHEPGRLGPTLARVNRAAK